jgi:hypothetical protein
MEDFAYLFSDSTASWLEGRGDTRFHRYESFHRQARANADNARAFDLERVNEQYALTCSRARGRLVAILDSASFKRLVLCLVLLWGGSNLLPTVGHSQPIATGIVLVGLLVGSRVKGRRGRARNS